MPILFIIIASALLGSNVVFGGAFVSDVLTIGQAWTINAVNAINNNRYIRKLKRGLIWAFWLPIAGTIAACLFELWKPYGWQGDLTIFLNFLFSIGLILAIWYLADLVLGAGIAITLLPGVFRLTRDNLFNFLWGWAMWESHIGLLLYLVGPTYSFPLFGLLIMALVAYSTASVYYKKKVWFLPYFFMGEPLVIIFWVLLALVTPGMWLGTIGVNLQPRIRPQNWMVNLDIMHSSRVEGKKRKELCETKLAESNGEVERASDFDALDAAIRKRDIIWYRCTHVDS